MRIAKDLLNYPDQIEFIYELKKWFDLQNAPVTLSAK
jgi:hypothetical protein